MDAPCTITLVTPHTSGAVATLQLTGDVAPILAALTTTSTWPVGAIRLTSIAGIDDGLVVRVRDDAALLMPHGGLRIVHQIAEAAVSRGAALAGPADLDPLALFPEALDATEALMLAALARAESPLAIDLLLDQPNRWRNHEKLTTDDWERSRRLNRLMSPPLVVLAGAPNVGKSTLSNALIGRSVSITADMPGTTRDYTAGRIDIAGLVVDWADTPGLRASDDTLEQRSISIAARLMARADLVIAMTAPGAGWPDLPRAAGLFVVNKIDVDDSNPVSPAARPPIRVSALTGTHLDALAGAIREALVPEADLEHPGPWLFDERLQSAR